MDSVYACDDNLSTQNNSGCPMHLVATPSVPCQSRIDHNSPGSSEEERPSLRCIVSTKGCRFRGASIEWRRDIVLKYRNRTLLRSKDLIGSFCTRGRPRTRQTEFPRHNIWGKASFSISSFKHRNIVRLHYYDWLSTGYQAISKEDY